MVQVKLPRHLVLPSRLNRPPLPSCSLPDDVTQPGEREVKGNYQRLLNCSFVQKSAPCGYNLLGSKIDHCVPFWLLQMHGVKNSIRDAQQLLAS
jgi:hypothetical protein